MQRTWNTHLLTLAVLLVMSALSACSPSSSSFDNSIYSGGAGVNAGTGYTRTIFSSSNF